MGSSIQWLVENKVILGTVGGDYSREEMVARIAEIGKMLRETPPPCHLIIDASSLETFTTRIVEPISELRKNQAENNTGWILLISNSSVMRFFGTVAAKVMNDRFRPVASLEEAKQFLHYIEPMLFTEYAKSTGTPPGEK